MDSRHSPTSFDEYLTQLSTQLKLAPHEWSGELRQELRQHLEALVAAHMELGSSPEEAVAAALRQFGDPVLIGRWLSHESRRSNRWSRRAGLGWPHWVIEGVAISSGGLALASVVASWWLAGHPATPLTEGLMRTGVVTSALGQGLLILGGLVGGLTRALKTERRG
jgi:hypothetical protein